MADQSPIPNLFDQCDDYVLAHILAQIGDDPISRNNLRKTCARWRKLIAAPLEGTDSRSFGRTMYRAMKCENMYFSSVVPALDRISRDPNAVKLREYMFQSRSQLLERSMCAQNSRIFRDIVSRIISPNEPLHECFEVPTNAIRWPDLEEIIEIFESYARVQHIPIAQYIAQIPSISPPITEQDINNTIFARRLTSQSCGYTYYQLLRIAIIRRLFTGYPILRETLISSHLFAIADLITAQDTKFIPKLSYVTTEPTRVIFRANNGNISREIIDELIVRFSAPFDWYFLPMLHREDRIDPYLREKVKELFARHEFRANSFARIRAQLLSFDSCGFTPKWNLILEAQDASQDQLFLDVMRTQLRKRINTGFRDEEFTRVMLRNMVKLHYDTSFLARFIKEAHIRAQTMRYALREIVAREITIRDVRKYAHFFAKLILARETSQRIVKEYQVREIFRNPILRELYETYSYIGV